jgi:hypothetical protein
MQIINIADLKDPNDPQGRSYREINITKQHSIPIGALVEIKTGERLFVTKHTRDCDQTPLYSLGVKGSDCWSWNHGYPESRLKQITNEVDVRNPCPICDDTGRKKVYYDYGAPCNCPLCTTPQGDKVEIVKDLTEFEEEICKIFSKYRHYERGEIVLAYKRLRSFDKVLFALQMTSIFNISLLEATEFFVV